MSRIILEASGFYGNYQHLNGTSVMSFSYLDLIRSTISIGFPSWKSFIFRNCRGYFETVYHAIGTAAYTKVNNGNLALAENFYDLDSSEKNPISYRLGMAITKLVAEKKLNIPWLLHVDKLVEQGIATITSGTKERGDLAGLDKDFVWHVLESKGRSYKPTTNTINKGKKQAGRITSINGLNPATKSVCASHLQKNNTYTYLVDPPDGEDFQPTSWEIEQNNYLLFYYKELLQQLSELRIEERNIVIGNSNYPFYMYNIPGVKEISIGILDVIVSNVDNDLTNFIEILTEYQKQIVGYSNDDFYSFGLDGVLLMRNYC